MACQLLKAPRFVGLDTEEAQFKLGRGPTTRLPSPDRFAGGSVYFAPAGPRDLLPGRRGGQYHRNPDALPGTHAQPLAEAENRVNDKTLTVSGFL